MDTKNTQLDEQSRTKLDGIVNQMTQNQEPEQNIQAVVDDFKQKYGKQLAPELEPQKEPGFIQSTVQGIASPFLRLASTGKTLYDQSKSLYKEIKGDEVGSDKIDETVKKDATEGVNYGYFGKAKPLGMSGSSVQDLKDSVGVGLEVGANVAGGAGGLNILRNIGTKTLAGLGLRGAISGAVSGGMTGLGTGLQDPTKSGVDIAKNTVTGTAVGGVTGGILAPVASGVGKITSGITGALEKRGISKVAERVGPRLDEKLVQESATTKSPITGRIDRVQTPRELETGELLKGIVKGKTFSEDKELVRAAISKEAESLKAAVSKYDHPVPKRELISSLKRSEVPDLVASDATLQGAWNRVIKRAEKLIMDDYDGTVSGLFEARKKFDQIIEDQFPNMYAGGKETPMKGAVRNIRQAWNDFVESQLPDDVAFKESLRKQNLMYDAMDNLSEKAAYGSPTRVGEIGTNSPQRFLEKHPKAVKAVTKGLIGLGSLGGIGGGYAGIKSLLKRN